jgi:hypothetical protein
MTAKLLKAGHSTVEVPIRDDATPRLVLGRHLAGLMTVSLRPWAQPNGSRPHMKNVA